MVRSFLRMSNVLMNYGWPSRGMDEEKVDLLEDVTLLLSLLPHLAFNCLQSI